MERPGAFARKLTSDFEEKEYVEDKRDRHEHRRKLEPISIFAHHECRANQAEEDETEGHDGDPFHAVSHPIRIHIDQAERIEPVQALSGPKDERVIAEVEARRRHRRNLTLHRNHPIEKAKLRQK
jgi:hypothetical protein